MIMSKKFYETLIVWQEAHKLCMSIYKLLPELPKHERYALASQLQRSAYSIPMNIVEGNAKRSHKEKLRFMEIAEASLDELDYQLYLASDLQYITKRQLDAYRKQLNKVAYLLQQFRKGIKNRASPASLASLAS